MYQRNFNKTKIIATIGPATESREMLKKLIVAGVDVCRLNFSHGEHSQHEEVIKHVRSINAELDSCVCCLLDLQGPKLRIGKVEGEIELYENDTLIVTTENAISTNKKIFVSYDRLALDAREGEHILLNDGKLEFVITRILNDKEVEVKVLAGGKLTSNKGFNLPHTDLKVPSMTEKDRRDLEFGIKQGVEWVALSFVRKPEDIIEVKQLIAAAGAKAKVIAKIEKPEAVENIDDIIKVTDGIMVARGDLGVEVPLQKVPLIQKTIVEKCIAASKPVIIATQMMESMIEDSMPTRAEINDVANAVLDGADAVMLSGETSIGKHPLKVIQIMHSIIADVEEDRRVYFKGQRPTSDSPSFASDEICFTAVRMSDHLKATAIVAMTKSGYTGFKVAGYRPKANIFIFTDEKLLLNTLSLVWGVRGIYYDAYTTTDQTFADVLEILKREKLVAIGDYVINCASMPIQKRQRTNTLKISVVE